MSTKGSMNYNNVTVIDKSKPNSAGKKIMIPQTLGALRKIAAKALGMPPDNAIKSIYSENNELIKSIDDVMPNTKIYVSTELPDSQFISASQVMQQPNTQNSVRFPTNSSSPRTSQLGSRLSLHSVSQLTRLGMSVSENMPPLNATGLGISSRPTSTLQNSGFRPPSTLQNKGSRPPSSLMIVLNDEASNNQSKLKKRIGAESNMMQDDTEDIDDNDNKRYSKKGISYRQIESLLSFLPVEISLAGDGTDSIVKNVSPLIGRFSTHIRDVQNTQEAYFYNYVIQNILKIPPHSNELDKYAEELVNNATFGTSCGAYTRFRAIITGPHQGGKSTFLNILSNMIYLRMLSSGQYKRTLFMVLDFKSMGNKINHPKIFYKEFIKAVFGQIAVQKIEFQPFREIITNYFIKIISQDKLAPLPNKFLMCSEFRNATIILNEIAQNLFDCLYKYHSLSDFISCLARFPRYIALGFGYTGVHFVVDHFDASDVDLIPESPLDGSNQSLPLIDYMKFMISNDSFIISSINEERLNESLELISRDGVDLQEGTEFISISDIDNGHSNVYEFLLTCEDTNDIIRLTRDECCGCSGFLFRWDSICETAQQMEEECSKNKNSREYKEKRLLLLGKLREFAPLVLTKYDPSSQTLTPLTNRVKDFVFNINKDLE